MIKYMRYTVLNKKALILLISVLLLMLSPVFSSAAEELATPVATEIAETTGIENSAFAQTLFGKLVITTLVAMLPVIELRGAIPVGVGMGLEYYVSVICSLIGNILPIPFVILFFRKTFEFLAKKFKFCNKIWSALHRRVMKKSDIVDKYGYWGLCIFVAIPFPGTGAWTGAMIACLLDMPIKKSFPYILLGVFIAAVIVTSVTYLGFDVIF